MFRRSFLLGSLAAPLAAALPASSARAADGWMTTSDGVRLHVIEAGSPASPALVFVPGWTMPGWIFGPQIEAFGRAYHVVAMDPRGQGSSDVPAGGYDYRRRGEDIADLLASRLGNRPVVLVGWSLGVLDALSYVHQRGDGQLAGLVLIDNSIGEDPAPVPSARPRPRSRTPVPREVYMQGFVRSMFHRNPGQAYLDQLTDTALRTPPGPAAALLNYAVPRTYWRDAVYAVRKPVLYVVTPRFSAQAANLQARDPYAETEVFAGAGHALFVDESTRFNSLLEGWMRRRVWRTGL